MILPEIAPEVRLQRDYYTRTAGQYDAAHVGTEDEHGVACKIIAALLPLLGASTVLDVGAGTGRVATILGQLDPSLRVYGVDPVLALLQEARKKTRCPALVGDGARLPFADGAFDAAVATGVLHHVPDPSTVVREMLRVSRLAVFISDNNIFGAGSKAVRLLKGALYGAGLWRIVKFIHTFGKGYSISDGDGVAYSYSVFFSYRLLCQHAATVFNVPLRRNLSGRLSGSRLFSSQHQLVCAIKANLMR
jgi:SAM-dependent methyltransferase